MVNKHNASEVSVALRRITTQQFIAAIRRLRGEAKLIDQSSVAVTLVGNAAYRIPFAPSAWIEPTVGFRYMHMFAGATSSPYPLGQYLIGPHPLVMTDGELLEQLNVSA